MSNNRSLLTLLLFVGLLPGWAAAQTDYTVDELVLNGDQTVTFADPVVVTVDTPDQADDPSVLRITIADTTVRRKCQTSAQDDPQTCVIYFGGTQPAPDPDPDPVDSDNDGVVDGDDLCANTPANTPVDANGCSDDQNNASGDYCANVDTSAIECSPSVNFDSIYAAAGETRYTIPGGKVLSVPFTTQASSKARGYINYTTSESDSGIGWRFWFSLSPGGNPLSCDIRAFPRRFIEWSQNEDEGACFIGTASRVIYANYSVTKDGQPLNSSFRFFAQRYTLVAP